MEFTRASGILLHPTSLPGRFGVGDLGTEAYRFVDFLVEAGQSWWEILPLGPPGYGNSPYMCLSAFAGNPYLISLENLANEGLLEAADIKSPPCFPTHRVDYGWVMRYKMPLLVKSFKRFGEISSKQGTDAFENFCQRNAFWLDDYALFMALKQAHGGRKWTDWDEGAARREPQSLAMWCRRLDHEIEFWKYVQYHFFRQWQSLKGYCRENGVRLVGDIPIYVAHDSAEVWAHRELFHLDQEGNPIFIGGVPPDYFSATGQRWGNPLYRWDIMAQCNYQWWIDRFRVTSSLVDIVRLDHFRGFEAYWEVPATEPTAANGHWVKGPGISLLTTLKAQIGDINVIAEDLGVITPEVEALREQMGFPGMRVLQFAFGDDPKARQYRPHNHIKNCVVYTGTHDNDTAVGWFRAKPGSQTTQSEEEVTLERETLLRYAGTDGREVHWDMIRLALSSVACWAVFPLQDLFGLGSEARLNTPGASQGSWEWRFTADMLTDQLAHRLRWLTEVYDRTPRKMDLTG
jgi:4-alpha-glucanotransferase